MSPHQIVNKLVEDEEDEIRDMLTSGDSRDIRPRYKIDVYDRAGFHFGISVPADGISDAKEQALERIGQIQKECGLCLDLDFESLQLEFTGISRDTE